VLRTVLAVDRAVDLGYKIGNKNTHFRLNVVSAVLRLRVFEVPQNSDFGSGGKTAGFKSQKTRFLGSTSALNKERSRSFYAQYFDERNA
jgi:hypothetical protein